MQRYFILETDKLIPCRRTASVMNTINLDIFIILQYDTNRKVERLYEIRLAT